MLYKLKYEEYSATPVYNKANFRCKYLGTAPPYVLQKHKCFQKLLCSFLGFLISTTQLYFLSVITVTIIISLYYQGNLMTRNKSKRYQSSGLYFLLAFFLHILHTVAFHLKIKITWNIFINANLAFTLLKQCHAEAMFKHSKPMAAVKLWLCFSFILIGWLL